MKKIILAVVLTMASVASASNYSFRGVTDKNPLEYKTGEEMAFTVTVVDLDDSTNAVTSLSDKKIRVDWNLLSDGGVLDGSTVTSGTATSNPFTVTALPKGPGFVRLKLNFYVDGVAYTGGPSEGFALGAGADIDRIPEHPAPSDLENFWQEAVSLLQTTPFEGLNTPVCTNYSPSAYASSDLDYYLFELPMTNILRVSNGLSEPKVDQYATGIIALPRNVTPGSCGIVAKFDPYWFSRTDLPDKSCVFANGCSNIFVSVTRHGEYPVSSDRDYYTNLVAKAMSTGLDGSVSSYCVRNATTGDARDTDYYKMLLRDLRALQFVKQRFAAAWNGRDLMTKGTSMGGYQAIGVAALDRDVTACDATVPWSSDLSGYSIYGRLPLNHLPSWNEALGYVDLKNLAQFCVCPVSISAGLGDSTCPAAGEVLLYRNLQCPKRITFIQSHGHLMDLGIDCATYAFQDIGSVSRSRKTAALDTRKSGFLRLLSLRDVLPLAYSNAGTCDGAWPRGGLPNGESVSLVVTPVDADEALNERIVPVGSPETLVSAAGEGVYDAWSPTDGCYRVALVMGGSNLAAKVFLVAAGDMYVIRSRDSRLAALDTRRFFPRKPASAAEVLPFAYDTAWWADATAIAGITVTPLVNGVAETARQISLTVTNAVGTGPWSPTHREVYRAEIRPDAGDSLTVDLDLTEATNLVAMGVPQSNGDIVFTLLDDAAGTGKALNMPNAWLVETGVDRVVARDTARLGANGLPVWESYVLGLSPQEATSVLWTDFAQTADGTFCVSVRGLENMKGDLVNVRCELLSTDDLGKAFGVVKAEQSEKMFANLPLDGPLKFYKARARVYWK